MTKRRGCQGQFEPDSSGVQFIFSLNMFYNLRRSSPKAYAIMHKRDLISLPSVTEVEEPGSDSPHNNTNQQNAAAQNNDNQTGPSNQPGDEPDSGSESESELRRSVEELRKQVQQERKAVMQMEKERLVCELAEMKSPTTTSRNAPKQRLAKVKAGSPRRRVNVNNKVKAVRGGGIRRSINKKSPHRETIKNRRTVIDLRALNELSEAADTELADWGLSNIPSDESEPEEDQSMGDITVAHDGNQQKHSVERFADEIESLGRQALLQRNSHIPRPFVNVGRNYMNHASRSYNEFDNWESESSKHKSGIKDRVSEFVQVKHAYAHMGLPFEHSRQGKVGFHDLDYPLLVEGELGIILEPSLKVSNGELVGRLLLVQRVYEWPAVRDFYAAVLQRIERGMITWDRLDLASLELTIRSRAQLQGSNSTAYQGSTGRKWGYRP